MAPTAYAIRGRCRGQVCSLLLNQRREASVSPFNEFIDRMIWLLRRNLRLCEGPVWFGAAIPYPSCDATSDEDAEETESVEGRPVGREPTKVVGHAGKGECLIS